MLGLAAAVDPVVSLILNRPGRKPEATSMNSQEATITQSSRTSDVAVVLFDRAGQILQSNAQFRRFFPPAPDSGRQPAFAGFLDRHAVIRRLTADPETGEPSCCLEEPATDARGSRCQLVWTFMALPSVGAAGCLLGVGYDVAVYVTLQREMLHKASLIELGQLAMGMAHELNQPLNIIAMAADNAMHRLDREQDARDYMRSKLTRIAEQTVRATRIIDQMRIFGRRPSEEPENFSLGGVISNALGMVEHQLTLSNVRVAVEIADRLPVLRGHPLLLEQVFVNILLNARDAIHEHRSGGKVVIAAVQDPYTGGVRIEIRDNGGGIAPDSLPRIFEAFFTTKPPGRGTGLGLSIAAGIVHDMGGTISASNHDGGAVFVISLPDATDRVSQEESWKARPEMPRPC
jgi:signal transduction histidine kinase